MSKHQSSGRHFKLFYIFVALFCIQIILVEGVDRSRFKSCDQSGFCRRNRDYATQTDKETPYEIKASSIVIEKDKYLADIINHDNGAEFKLEISEYNHGIIRVKINEKEPLSTRYEVPDVISNSAALAEASSQRNGLIFGKLRIQNAPFKIDYYSEEGEHVLSTNQQGLFNIEHLRVKQEEVVVNFDLNLEGEEEGEQLETQPSTEATNSKYKRVKDDSLWAESFSSHSDSKPRGPSSVGMDFSFIGSEGVYGIPEHASTFALSTTVGKSDPYRLYNLDVFEYELDETMALYGSIPFMISQRQGKSTAIFWLNSSETWVDVDNSPSNGPKRVDTHWFSESGIADYFVFFGPTPKDVLFQYKYLTGFAPIPPLFSIAYHQCRWNYRDQEDVATVNEQFDEHNIPLDVIWLDIEHTDQKKYFTWDPKKFSEPKQMIDNVASKGRKMVTIVDPHIKRDHNYYIYNEAKELDFFIHNKDGKSVYEGWCWPGSSVYLDFTNPAVQSWWADQFSFDRYLGSTPSLFIWNDMNEPSVFNGPEVTTYKDLIHYNSVEHRDIHNLWGLYVHKSTAEGLTRRSANQNARSFVLSRAFFASSQRYGAIWTGDNKADWEHLAASVPMLLSINIAGLSFAGADVGGFFGDPDTELLIRWYQAGAYQPFFRAHAHLDTKRREPYLFGDDVTALLRSAIQTRYALLPYWYTQFYLDAQHGAPVMRPLWFDYPADRNAYVEDQYMVGSDLLIKPVTQNRARSLKVYFPGNDRSGRWFDVVDYSEYHAAATEEVQTPLEKIPVYQRGGSIVVRKDRTRRSSALMAKDPYTLVVALDQQQKAKGLLYVDDGESLDYTRAVYLLKSFEFSELSLRSVNLHQQYRTEVGIEKVIVIGLNRSVSKATYHDQQTGERLDVSVNTFKSPTGVSFVVLKKPANLRPLIDADQWEIILS